MQKRRAIPVEVRFAAAAPATVLAATEQAKEPRLEMCAYSGGPMDLGMSGPMYVDLSGMAIPDAMPILRQHEGTLVVGQSTSIKQAGGKLDVVARLFTTAAAREVSDLSAQGMKWQASIGFKIETGKLQWLDEPEHKASVNGREVCGPAVIARKSTLKEASVVPLGADCETSATVLAYGGSRKRGGDWIAAVLGQDKAEDDGSSADSSSEEEDHPVADKTPDAPKGASLAELKAAFPKDREFALDQFEAGATLGEAKAAYADVLQKKLDEAEEKAAAAKPAPAAPAKAPRLPVPVTTSASASPVSAAARWDELVRAEQKNGKTFAAARSFVANAHPELHAAYVSEVNGGAEWQKMGMPTPSGIARR